MKVLKSRLRGMVDAFGLTYHNAPTLEMLVDEMPKDFVYRTNGKGLYYGEKDGLVSFYFHSGNPERQSGFGGSTFTLPMEDGTVKTLVGPWSSRAGVMNAHGFGPCLDVTLTDDPDAWERGWTMYAGHCTLAVALEAIQPAVMDHQVKNSGGHLHTAFGVALVKTEEHGDVVFEPVLVKADVLAGKLLVVESYF